MSYQCKHRHHRVLLLQSDIGIQQKKAAIDSIAEHMRLTTPKQLIDTFYMCLPAVFCGRAQHPGQYATSSILEQASDAQYIPQIVLNTYSLAPKPPQTPGYFSSTPIPRPSAPCGTSGHIPSQHIDRTWADAVVALGGPSLEEDEADFLFNKPKKRGVYTQC